MDELPPFYFEWAATIEALPAHEQGTTLAAMPDEDAAVIQRILRSNAKRWAGSPLSTFRGFLASHIPTSVSVSLKDVILPCATCK